MYHKSRIDGCSNITSKRVPTFGVEEIPEFFEIVVDQILGGSEIEPGIEFMDNGFVTNDGKYSNQGGYGAYEQEYSKTYGWFPLVNGGIRP